jgi:hypothetical protein
MAYGQLEQISIRIPNPPKAALVRLPRNQEVLDRLAQQKSIRRNLGRRKSRTEFLPNHAADLALFNAIRLDKGAADFQEFDEFEASTAISKLTFCEVVDCERVGDEYRVTLKTPFGDTTHTMQIPTQRDIMLYRRLVVASTDLPHGQEELRYRTEPAVDLYDTVVSRFEGYSASYSKNEVPPHHKSAVVVELVQAIDDLDPALDPNL